MLMGFLYVCGQSNFLQTSYSFPNKRVFWALGGTTWEAQRTIIIGDGPQGWELETVVSQTSVKDLKLSNYFDGQFNMSIFQVLCHFKGKKRIGIFIAHPQRYAHSKLY